MKKFELNLSKYDVEVLVRSTEEGVREMVKETRDYPIKDNISDWLRSPGIFRTGEDIAEAVLLARTIRESKEDTIVLDEREAGLLKTGINKLLELTADHKANLGGPIHEEAICRIFTMKEVG